MQVLNAGPTNGSEDQNQNKLGVSERSFHGDKYPYIDEFSEFISHMSTKSLKSHLMTLQQRLLAKSMWEATNFGGSKRKCVDHLIKIYGPNWWKITSIKAHMEEERVYCEYVLILDHMQQWNNHKKVATLCERTTAQ